MMKTAYISLLVYACVVSDMREGVIRNTISIPAIFLGLLCIFLEKGSGGVISSIKAIFSSFLISLFLFRMRVIGGGDGKFLIAGASVCGFPEFLNLFFLSFLCGAIQVVFDGIMDRRLRETLGEFIRFLTGRAKSGKYVVFSPFIGMGLFCAGGMK